MIRFLVLFIFLSLQLSAQNKKFSFIAFGDMPYRVPQDYPKFERVIQRINQEKPAFTVHVGDFKSGSSLCTNEYYERMRSYFTTFEQAMVYTPGDNEWTDCDRKLAGEYVPEERLSVLRKMFFEKPVSFGKKPLKLVTQAQLPGFETFVENNAWTHEGIQFATIHLVGSNNHFKTDSVANVEFLARNKANLAWLDYLFAQAGNLKALVLVTQADMFFTGVKPTKGFEDVLNKLRDLSQAYKKPVLLINGDSHRFITDKPILINNQKETLMNFTRVQVFGDGEMAAVKITYDPKASQLFVVEQLMIE
jgi:hypothetical protein